MTEEWREEWRAKLDVALDAMKIGSANGARRDADFDGKQIAEEIFKELDGLHPGWHFKVPMRARAGRRDPELEAKRILAAMLSWDGWTATRLATVFGVSTTTAITYIRRGEKLLLADRTQHFSGLRLRKYRDVMPSRPTVFVTMVDGRPVISPGPKPSLPPAEIRALAIERALRRAALKWKEFPTIEEDHEPEDKRRYHRWLAAGSPDTARAVAWIANGLQFESPDAQGSA